jgi:hypothetical protein
VAGNKFDHQIVQATIFLPPWHAPQHGIDHLGDERIARDCFANHLRKAAPTGALDADAEGFQRMPDRVLEVQKIAVRPTTAAASGGVRS